MGRLRWKHDCQDAVLPERSRGGALEITVAAVCMATLEVRGVMLK